MFLSEFFLYLWFYIFENDASRYIFLVFFLLNVPLVSWNYNVGWQRFGKKFSLLFQTFLLFFLLFLSFSWCVCYTFWSYFTVLGCSFFFLFQFCILCFFTLKILLIYPLAQILSVSSVLMSPSKAFFISVTFLFLSLIFLRDILVLFYNFHLHAYITHLFLCIVYLLETLVPFLKVVIKIILITLNYYFAYSWLKWHFIYLSLYINS